MRGAQFKHFQSSEDRRRNLFLNGRAGKSSWERLWWSWVWRVDLIWTLEAGGRRNHLCEWVCRTLLKANQDPGFPTASCWLSSETLPATYLPAPVLTLSSWSSDEGWWSRSHAVSGSWLHYLLSGSSHESWGSFPFLASSTFLFYTASSPSTEWITLKC